VTIWCFTTGFPCRGLRTDRLTTLRKRLAWASRLRRRTAAGLHRSGACCCPSNHTRCRAQPEWPSLRSLFHGGLHLRVACRFGEPMTAGYEVLGVFRATNGHQRLRARAVLLPRATSHEIKEEVLRLVPISRPASPALLPRPSGSRPLVLVSLVTLAGETPGRSRSLLACCSRPWP